MKKNGFTLVELIGIITILAVILLVSLPALSNTLENNTDKKYETFLNNLYMITENYVMENIDQFPNLKEENGRVEITINDLKKAGYRTKLTNPKTDSIVLDTDKIIVTRNADKTYSYQFVASN